jgi:hypothetical protein
VIYNPLVENMPFGKEVLRLCSFITTACVASAVLHAAQLPTIAAARLNAGTALPLIDGLVNDEAWAATSTPTSCR